MCSLPNGKMTQPVKATAFKVDVLYWSLSCCPSGSSREPTPESCPLTSIKRLEKLKIYFLKQVTRAFLKDYFLFSFAFRLGSYRCIYYNIPLLPVFKSNK